MRGTGSDGDADYVLEGFPLLPARLNPIDWKACVSPNPPQVALGFFSTLKIRGALSAELCWERTGGLHSDARQLSAAEDGWRAAAGQRPSRSESRACPEPARGPSRWAPPSWTWKQSPESPGNSHRAFSK